MSEDTYKTITEVSEGTYTEKRSKFIAIALPVRTLEEIKNHLETYQKKYYDARRVCYAYMLGHERKNFRANDQRRTFRYGRPNRFWDKLIPTN